MAKKQQKEKSIEETLWESANKLRGSVEPSEYKHVVLTCHPGHCLQLGRTCRRYIPRRPTQGLES